MRKIAFIISICLIFAQSILAQSIRKNYQEMTQSEKDELVNALYALRTGPDLINDLAIFHDNNFNAIHFNLPFNPSIDVFLAWHRRQIFELEQAMQDLNPNLSIPFWDWTTDNSTTSALWDFSFLGQFDAAWGLGRDLGSGSLPTSSDVSNIQSITNWLVYSNDLERGIVHVGAHNWVADFGGVMASGDSPRDPVFYFHHGMVDKLWEDWTEANNITPSSNIYQATTLPRYDGTYVFNGQTLPSVNPDDIVNSKVLGVFFAENQLAELEDYTVSNAYRATETFYYQYTIEASDFIVPSGTDAKIESVNEVVLKEGFHALTGADFIAKIDGDNNTTTAAKKGIVYQPFDRSGVLKDVFSGEAETMNLQFNAYPNPTTGIIHLNLTEMYDGLTLKISDLQGSIVLEKNITDQYFDLDISGLESGLYFIQIMTANSVLSSKKIVKQ